VKSKLSVLIRLCAMMFLQYAVWGAWTVVLYPYVTNDLGFTPNQASWAFGALWLACILAPFTGGQIADRGLPSQIFLAICHFGGCALMFAMAYAKEFPSFMLFMGAYSLLYAPTLAITNSVAFAHMTDREREFGAVRVFGTLGWIVAGWALMGIRYLKPELGTQGDMLLLAGALSGLMGIVCLALPHTPPAKEGTNPLAFVEAFRMLKDKQFLLFLAISFIVTTELQFYYMPTADFLEKQVSIAHEKVSSVMTVAQIAELVCMSILLAIFLKKIGIRKTLAIGVIAWPLRYVVFAFGSPEMKYVVIGSLALHGLGYTFFFVASQIYVDKISPKDIRGSAQSLLTLVTLGLGNFLGTLFTGWIIGKCSAKVPVSAAEMPTSDQLLAMAPSSWAPWAKVSATLPSAQDIAAAGQGTVEATLTNWSYIFLVPCALTVTCALLFLLLFRDPRADVTTTLDGDPVEEAAA